MRVSRCVEVLGALEGVRRNPLPRSIARPKRTQGRVKRGASDVDRLSQRPHRVDTPNARLLHRVSKSLVARLLQHATHFFCPTAAA